MTADEQREFDQLKRIYEAAKEYTQTRRLYTYSGAVLARTKLEDAIRDYELNVRVKI